MSLFDRHKSINLWEIHHLRPPHVLPCIAQRLYSCIYAPLRSANRLGGHVVRQISRWPFQIHLNHHLPRLHAPARATPSVLRVRFTLSCPDSTFSALDALTHVQPCFSHMHASNHTSHARASHFSLFTHNARYSSYTHLTWVNPLHRN